MILLGKQTLYGHLQPSPSNYLLSPSAWRVSFTAYSELNLATKISTTSETFSFLVSNTFIPGWKKKYTGMGAYPRQTKKTIYT